MVSEVHILGQLWQRCLGYRDYQRCTVKPLHKCFSRHQMEGSFTALYFPYGKVSETWKGHTLAKGILLEKELYERNAAG